ncbi:OsmC family protein [Bacteroidota bacterium]
MYTVHTKYIGDLRTKAKHLQSGNEIITDAPLDNQGKGEAFSPTDMLATALGSCMITIVGIKARDAGFNIDGTELKITKIMYSEPRRVGEVHIEFIFPENNYTEREKKIIENAAKTCPVAKSIHPDLKLVTEFKYN